ncbi:putative tyrosine protein phosphatase MIH1 SCDLUD_004150 [Saccharomycodes ludwigii]|uniref:putative tyrosine protein phosphatase MIH1 n=1 Tax=Saccharomycodes ludwigii TaxID=36035 RepID=UPI001E89970D|nr:hypothetical protein SCDLUD_004150 [Saccharomycodes ludwigii]KAH3899851.1 hypothetical protein SCDLUD_004150 [Saccharomycodes ludwigii]
MLLNDTTKNNDIPIHYNRKTPFYNPTSDIINSYSSNDITGLIYKDNYKQTNEAEEGYNEPFCMNNKKVSYQRDSTPMTDHLQQPPKRNTPKLHPYNYGSGSSNNLNFVPAPAPTTLTEEEGTFASIFRTKSTPVASDHKMTILSNSAHPLHTNYLAHNLNTHTNNPRLHTNNYKQPSSAHCLYNNPTSSNVSVSVATLTTNVTNNANANSEKVMCWGAPCKLIRSNSSKKLKNLSASSSCNPSRRNSVTSSLCSANASTITTGNNSAHAIKKRGSYQNLAGGGNITSKNIVGNFRLKKKSSFTDEVYTTEHSFCYEDEEQEDDMEEDNLGLASEDFIYQSNHTTVESLDVFKKNRSGIPTINASNSSDGNNSGIDKVTNDEKPFPRTPKRAIISSSDNINKEDNMIAPLIFGDCLLYGHEKIETYNADNSKPLDHCMNSSGPMTAKDRTIATSTYTCPSSNSKDIHKKKMQFKNNHNTAINNDNSACNPANNGYMNARNQKSNEYYYSSVNAVDDFECNGIPYITPDLFSELLKKNITKDLNDDTNLIVIDCRFEYEYKGGHIKTSLNINDHMLLQSYLFKRNNYLTAENRNAHTDYAGFFTEKHNGEVPTMDADNCDGNLSQSCETIVVLYCEFTKYRSPTLAQFIRKLDRELNLEYYPELYYPNLCILKGGYNNFHVQYPELCEGDYIPMVEDFDFDDKLDIFRSRSYFLMNNYNNTAIDTALSSNVCRDSNDNTYCYFGKPLKNITNVFNKSHVCTKSGTKKGTFPFKSDQDNEYENMKKDFNGNIIIDETEEVYEKSYEQKSADDEDSEGTYGYDDSYMAAQLRRKIGLSDNIDDIDYDDDIAMEQLDEILIEL